jgi:hypothetical protein
MTVEQKWDSSLNTKLWDSAYKTDRKYTKEFKARPGGFGGTAISPMYIVRKATEIFGPCGIRWGFNDIGHTVEDTGVGKVWYSLIRLWYIHPATNEYGHIEQWGGTTITTGKADHPVPDDEAAKKAVTDGLTKCLTYLGFGADIHLNDTSKYSSHETGYNDQGAAPAAPPVHEPSEKRSAKQVAKDLTDKHTKFPAALEKVLGAKDLAELSRLADYINGFGFTDSDLAELTAAIQAKANELTPAEATGASNTNA